MANDQIEKQIELKAPVSRVWRALTDYREFGEWFRVKLESPFIVGKASRGQPPDPGFDADAKEAFHHDLPGQSPRNRRRLPRS